MEFTLMRAFVLMISLTGFGATTVAPKTSAPVKSNAMMSSGSGVTAPTALCAPSDPSYCGMH